MSIFRLTLVLLGCVLLVACSSVSTEGPTDIKPVAAVIGAAEAPLSGTFRLQVRGTGRQDGRLYLNSEPDYRDQRCLTIAILDSVAKDLEKSLSGDPAVVLKGRTIRVRGVARKVKIVFVEKDGTFSDSYYYQTHVRVTDPAQIEIL